MNRRVDEEGKMLRRAVIGAVMAVLGACGGRTGADTKGSDGVDAGAANDASTAHEAGTAIDASLSLDAGNTSSSTADAGSGLDASSDGADDAPVSCTLCDAGACVDTQSDPLHCGACGNDCGGGVCTAGSCGLAPVQVASSENPGAIAVDDAGVYWLNILPQPVGDSGHTQIMSRSLGAGATQPTVLWDGLYPLTALSVVNGTLYFPTGPGGGTSTYGQNPSVLTCATTGCSSGATTFATSSSDIWTLRASPAVVVWSDSVQVLSCSPAGCSGSPMLQAMAIGEIFNLATTANAFAFLDEGNAIGVCPASGCGDAGPTTVTTAIGTYPQALAMDDANVYWIASTVRSGGGKTGPIAALADGAVYACPLSGCPGGPTALARYPLWLGGISLVSDGVNVYWAFEDINDHFGTVVRCAVGGCGGQPVALGTTAGPNSAPGLAVDGTRVYWSDPGRGAVMAAPK